MKRLCTLALAALALLGTSKLQAQQADSTTVSPWKASISAGLNLPATIYRPGFFVGSNTITTYGELSYKNLSGFIWDNTDTQDGTYERDFGLIYSFPKEGRKITPSATVFFSHFTNNKLNSSNDVLMSWLSATYKHNNWKLDATLHNVFHLRGENKTTNFVEDVINTNNTLHLSASKTFNFDIDKEKDLSASITPQVRTSFNNDFFYNGERFLYALPTVTGSITKGNTTLSGTLGYHFRTVGTEDLDFFTVDNPSQLNGNITVTHNFTFK